MQGEPLVSVVVAAYNLESDLPRCVDSILSQTHSCLDVVLVDDGSTDGTARLCDEFALRDPRVRVYHTQNGGLSRARNFGIERAFEIDSEYLAFVDGDDCLEPTMMEVLVRTLVGQRVDAVQCGHIVQGFTGVKYHSQPLERFSGRDVMVANIRSEIDDTAWNKLYVKRLFEQVRYPEGRVYEDIATTCKVLALCDSAARVPDCCYRYFMRSGSIVHTNTVANLASFWEAHKGRREFCLSEAGEWLDEELRDVLLLNETAAGVKAWRWGYACKRKGASTREKADLDALLGETVLFARASIPMFGRRGWPFFARLGSLVMHIGHPALLPVMYCLNQLYIRLRPGRSTTKR